MIKRFKDGVWEVWSPAKLNLTLEVLGKRPDGFHNIRSLMTQISLWDTITLAKNNSNVIDITIDDRRARAESQELDPIPTDSRNLIAKALIELKKCSGVKAGACVHLTKRVPSQAGLGGGSSNAAAALMAANELWDLNWPRDRLMPIAAKIGSDISFFLSASPNMCHGTGNTIPSREGVSIPNTTFVVIRPPIGLSTADVFGRYKACETAEPPDSLPKQFLPSLTRTNCLYRLGQLLRNDLQRPAMELTPWIGKLRSVFGQLDVIAHQMSGSGTAYFGVCRNFFQAKRVAGYLRNRRMGDVFLVRTLVARNKGSRDAE